MKRGMSVVGWGVIALSIWLSATPDVARADEVTGLLANGYVHEASQRGAQVWQDSSTGNWVFQNEKGARAIFSYVSPSKLEQVSNDGGWDAQVSVTVIVAKESKQLILWFSKPDGWHDNWVRAL